MFHRPLVSKLWLLAALGLGAQASAVTVGFDPGAAGLAGAAFSADALTGTEVSVVSNGPPAGDGSFSWHERGFMHITGSLQNGVQVLPSGLDSQYTLYAAFDILGVNPNIVSPGHSTAVTMALYGVNGVSVFGLGPAGAFVDNQGNAPVLLASAANAAVSVASTLVSLTPLTLDLSASMTADLVPAPVGFITSPGLALSLLGSFSHPHDGVTVLYGGGAFVIDGGSDVLSFAPSPVPEPAHAALLAGGLALLAGLARQRRSA